MENNSKVHIPVIIAGMLMISNNIAAQQLNTDFKKDFKNDKTDSELKLNEDAIKLIKFDFMPEMNNDATKPLEAPLKKPWMEFKADLATVDGVQGRSGSAQEPYRHHEGEKAKRIYKDASLLHMDKIR